MANIKNTISSACLVAQGFKYQSARQYLKLKNKHENPEQLKTIMRMVPFNTAFDKMLNDILSAGMVLKERSECFAAPYALVVEQEGNRQLCPLPDETSGTVTADAASLLALLREKSALLIRGCKNAYPVVPCVWRYADGRYYADGAEVSKEKLQAMAQQLPEDMLISAYTEPAAGYGCTWPVLHLLLVKTESGEFVTAREYIADVEDFAGAEGFAPGADDVRVAAAREFADYVSRKFYELPYLHFTMLLSEDGFTLMQLDTGRDLAYFGHLPEKVTQMVERMAQQRPALTMEQRKEQAYKYYTSWQAKQKGFVDFMYRNWLRGLKADNELTCTTQEEKRWAHERGFYSYHIKQYNLTEENYRDILSDYDYKRLRPLNCRYHKWLWDKLMAYFVLSPFREHLPIYYYRIVPDNGKNVVIPYDPCEEDCTAADVVALLRRVGKLAVKPAVGSHGEGFYKMTFDGECFRANDEVMSAQALETLFEELESTYIISEYIEMHSELKKIYDKVACTIRVMTIRQGEWPYIKDAYFRIGTSFTGNTDNLGSGGVAAPVDAVTGRFGKAQLLVNHEFKTCNYHPDTGARVEGQLPNWDMVRATIGQICDYLAPLEYLGFDIVITDDGFKILEINTHQDLHKYVDYPREVKDYFKGKLQLRDQGR